MSSGWSVPRSVQSVNGRLGTRSCAKGSVAKKNIELKRRTYTYYSPHTDPRTIGRLTSLLAGIEYFGTLLPPLSFVIRRF